MPVSTDTNASHDVPELNHTSFAYHMTTAMAMYLDAVTVTGTARRHRWSLAVDCAMSAIEHHGTPEERLVASHFLQGLRAMDAQGMTF